MESKNLDFTKEVKLVGERRRRRRVAHYEKFQVAEFVGFEGLKWREEVGSDEK